MEIQPRTVALFDVLGFRELVRTTPLVDLTNRYHRILGNAKAFNRPIIQPPTDSLFPDHPASEPWCIQHVFSDTIIAIADAATEQSTLRLLVSSWRLLQFFLAAGFPLRGAIAHGEMSVDENANIFLGQALVDAYELESMQQWMGAAIHDSVLEACPELAHHIRSENSLFSNVFRRYPVPLKNGCRVELHTLNWRFNMVVRNGTRSLFPPARDPEARAKQTNALDYARHVVDSGKVYARGVSKPPLELRTFFVGDTQPPFEHGDEL